LSNFKSHLDEAVTLKIGNDNGVGNIFYMDEILNSILESESGPDKCQIRIAESIPIGLTYNGSDPDHLPTYQVRVLF